MLILNKGDLKTPTKQNGINRNHQNHDVSDNEKVFHVDKFIGPKMRAQLNMRKQGHEKER